MKKILNVALIMPCFYAVSKGRNVGVFYSWNECKQQIDGFHHAKFKKFTSLAEAKTFLNNNSDSKQVNVISKKNLYSQNKKQKYQSIYKKKELSKKKKNTEANKNIEKDNLIPVVYTDGACFKNGLSNAKAGFGVFWGDNHPDNISCPVEGIATNNRAEYMAVICALRQAISRGYSSLKIRTDSNLLIQSLTIWIKNWEKNGWKKRDNSNVVNVDLVKETNNLMNQINVKFEHVNSHVGIYGNEMADLLAKKGAEKYQKK